MAGKGCRAHRCGSLQRGLLTSWCCDTERAQAEVEPACAPSSPSPTYVAQLPKASKLLKLPPKWRTDCPGMRMVGRGISYSHHSQVSSKGWQQTDSETKPFLPLCYYTEHSVLEENICLAYSRGIVEVGGRAERSSANDAISTV